MPTAAEFESAAQAFERERDSMSGVASGARSSGAAEVVQGATLERVVLAAVTHAADLSASAVSACDELVGIARERAEVCRQYTQRYRWYQAALRSYQWQAMHLEPGQYLGSPPYPPVRPAPWAEVG